MKTYTLTHEQLMEVLRKGYRAGDYDASTGRRSLDACAERLLQEALEDGGYKPSNS